MKTYTTSLLAVDPTDDKLKKWGGPNIQGISQKDAERYCQLNGLGYLWIEGELVAEIPCKTGSFEPDFKNMIDYTNTQNN
jgi:hypothetical protein